MASKFGGKQAIANHWVMQQNMARQKSFLVHAPKTPHPKPKAVPAAEPVAPTETTAEQSETPAS